MKKMWKAVLLGAGTSVFAWAGLSLADETNNGRDFQIKNRLRIEYDDNVFESSNKHGSGKIEEEVEFIYNLDLEQTYIGMRYRPSVVYWMDRPSDSWDTHHDFDLDFNHSFSPRATLALKESFLYAELPELMDRGIILQQKDNYFYNRANADFDYLLQPHTKLGLGGRYTLLRYQDSAVSAREDYDIYAGGATLRRQLSPDTTISGEARFESITYSGPNRDSTSEYLGGGVEQNFGPDLLGNLRGGLQHKDFSASAIDAQNQPYADGSLTILTPSHRTRLTTGAGYSMFESDVFPYANQDRTLIYLSASHDLTAKISLFLSGSYQNSAYKGNQSVDKSVSNSDGTEDVVQVAARASYKVNRNNWLEAGYQYLNVNSDVRPDYDRTRLSVGWRMTL
jgi:hypothetical protein